MATVSRTITRPALTLRLWVFAGLAIAFFALQVPPAAAYSINGLATEEVVTGPPGWIALCASHPGTCLTTEAETAVTLDDAQLRWLTEINLYYNDAIRPVHDQGADHWDLGVSEGDCEEFALAKQQALLAAGYPAGAVRLAVAQKGEEYHAVLTVETTGGTLVLDNLRDDVEPFEALPYQWVLLERKDRAVTWSVLR